MSRGVLREGWTQLGRKEGVADWYHSNPYQGHPCHIEVFLSTPTAEIPRSKDLDVAGSSKKAKKVAAIEA